jgi:hypothetical protein
MSVKIPDKGHPWLLIVNRKMYDNMSEGHTCSYIGVAFFTYRELLTLLPKR